MASTTLRMQGTWAFIITPSGSLLLDLTDVAWETDQFDFSLGGTPFSMGLHRGRLLDFLREVTRPPIDAIHASTAVLAEGGEFRKQEAETDSFDLEPDGVAGVWPYADWQYVPDDRVPVTITEPIG